MRFSRAVGCLDEQTASDLCDRSLQPLTVNDSMFPVITALKANPEASGQAVQQSDHTVHVVSH